MRKLLTHCLCILQLPANICSLPPKMEMMEWYTLSPNPQLLSMHIPMPMSLTSTLIRPATSRSRIALTSSKKPFQNPHTIHNPPRSCKVPLVICTKLTKLFSTKNLISSLIPYVDEIMMFLGRKSSRAMSVHIP